ncbi:IS3 family transposase [Collinsella tanakaei]|uniref:IS3 family transposase n=1 Tax=Collinsella tanakaei TaxID=626935 RepID=UPI001F33D0F4|nr:IS3 family transposase [Collinsella tanakaei]MCF2620677.1 IS3 family transposase [Collinsella tanakaei]
MHDRETVELALAALGEGMTHAEAAELVGASERSVYRWAGGRLPRSCAGRPPGSGKMGATSGERKAARMSTRGLYDPPATGPLAGLEPAQIENLLLRAVLADLKAGGWDPGSISSRSKCELGERLRRETGLPLRSITGFLRISRSSYEYHRARLGVDRDAAIRRRVVELFEASGGAYGYRRVHAALRARGVRVSEKRVRRVMREEGLEAARPRARRYGSYAGEEGRAPAPNLLLADASRDLHDFSATAPGEVLVTDVTEFRLPDDRRKVYLSPCIVLFDGDVAAFSCGTSPSKALVGEMLAVAATGGGFTLHSDRGWHCRTPDWVAGCAAAGVTRSMSRRGHSPDNAACEGFFGRLKVEFFFGRDWRGWTAEAFIAELSAYIRWYREGRLKAFREGGRTVYDTIRGRRRRLGLAA